MLFITNRVPEGELKSNEGRTIEFAQTNNSVSQSVYYCERTGPGEYIELTSRPFMERLKQSPYKQVLFYLHGFSNLPEPDIFPRAVELQALFDRDPDLILVVPIIWPCDADAGIVEDYWDDQKSADASGPSFARVLEKFMAWRNDQDESDPCFKRINVLAHSMGNRVLRESLRAWDRYDLSSGVPLLFRNTFLVAADVVNEALEVDQPGSLIAHASRSVVVYYASDDLALRASKISNLRNRVASRRLGHTGPEDMDAVPKNVYAVDCDDVNTRYDPPKGHTYFLSDASGRVGRVFQHMRDTIDRGRVFPGQETRRTVILED